MSKKFSIEQLSAVTGWEPKKLAKLFVLLRKNNSAQQDDLLTKLAQTEQGVGKGMVNPVGDVVEGLQRKLPERGPLHGTGIVPVVQNIPYILKKIQRAPMAPPDAQYVVKMLQDAAQNPESATAYLAQVGYMVKKNLKSWQIAMDAPNSAEWKRLVNITGLV
ncbi:MAG TPA: hypothetical protein VMW91_03955 [Desulfosporosinus sp.]|nr:hypothetical protein [Desulfosporosinus sp.]